MKLKKIFTFLLVIILILSLGLISCRSNDISQESPESEEVKDEAIEILEGDEEKNEDTIGEEIESEEIVEEAKEIEEEEYNGMCSNSYFPVKPDFLWTYLAVSPSETYEFTSSFYEISDSSFTEMIESLVFNADIKWLCSADGMIQSEYNALVLEEDDQGIELTTESYDGITLPSQEKWIVGYKWDTIYKVKSTVIVEDEQMTFTGDIIINNEIVSIEEVIVPAGTFPDSVKIELDKNMNISADIAGNSMSFNAYTDISSWYVEETGLVKQVSKATCGTTTVELLSIEEKGK